MLLNKNSMIYQADETMQPGQVFFSNRFMSFIQPMKLLSEMLYISKPSFFKSKDKMKND